MDSAKIIIKRMLDISKSMNNKELSEELGVSYDTLNTWIKRDSIPMKKINEFVQKRQLNYNWLLIGKGNTFLEQACTADVPQQITALVNKSYELNPDGLQKKLVEFAIENSVKQKLKNYDKTQPFLKFFFGERLDKMSSYRIIIKALNNSNIDLETLKIEDAKEILLDIIKNYKLQMVDFINYTLTEKDHANALKFVETLENLDAYIILMDIKLAIEAFNESIKYLTVTPLKQKITGKD